MSLRELGCCKALSVSVVLSVVVVVVCVIIYSSCSGEGYHYNPRAGKSESGSTINQCRYLPSRYFAMNIMC